MAKASPIVIDPESQRLDEDASRKRNWKRWGPYISERQWGTVREDYSPGGSCWDFFPHDQARSRAYRWGEDGLMGWCDRQGRICFALALWNGKDPILKERLFGLSGPEGNHGEDVKELYYYLDSTPTHSYAKGLYKYPQAEFPYRQLVEANQGRPKNLPEYEITDTGVFAEDRYFDVFVEYAKPGEEDTCVRVTIYNRGRETAVIHVLPHLWFRNTWTWPDEYDSEGGKPSLRGVTDKVVEVDHPTLGQYHFEVDGVGELLFTENETNKKALFGADNEGPYVKDAFHRYVIRNEKDAVNPGNVGTKAAAHRVFEIASGGSVVLRCRLRPKAEAKSAAFGKAFEATFDRAIAEADQFYEKVIPHPVKPADREISRAAYAGMLWNKQFYYYVVETWLEGDARMPKPPASRLTGRNSDWGHVFIRDVLSMPDKWEYPWFAAWDLAFHTVTIAKIDPALAKEQLLLLLREWYMHPSGQIPAYEFQFGDVNPPVHAWATWRVYKETGRNDRVFLERVFQKLMLNFTWWVNRKDAGGKHLFSGGFLGLDNIGVFDRSKPLPGGGSLTQADGTSWMAFYCLAMLSMALELALDNPAYEDIASKFFEHFVAITHAINTLGGTGLWDDPDGFYYDQLNMNGEAIPLKVRSMVGMIPLLAVSVLDERIVDGLPGFRKRLDWFLEHLPDLGRHVTRTEGSTPGSGKFLLAVVPLHRLTRVLSFMLDEDEFLAPHGLRSLSRHHLDKPFSQFGPEYLVRYDPGDSTTGMFGGNSNWRGPIWFPLNVVLIQVLERYYHFYGDGLVVPCPTGSGKAKNLHQVAEEIGRRLVSLFQADKTGRRPCHGTETRYATDPHFRNLLLFHEYFDGDSGRGIGAMHQTGWTGLVANIIEDLATQESLRAVEADTRKAIIRERQSHSPSAHGRGASRARPSDVTDKSRTVAKVAPKKVSKAAVKAAPKAAVKSKGAAKSKRR
jgi:hypothetical protein